MVQLTFDLYELIIDQLAEVHSPSLRNCALVCLDFSKLCRKHLFRSIVLDSTERRYTRRFDRLLNRHPSIAQHTRDLTFKYNTTRRNVGPPVLHRLNRVRKFTLQLGNGTEEYCGDPSYDWQTAVPARHRAYFYSFIHANSIVHLRLANVQNIPALILTYFPHLAYLEVDNVSVCDAPLEGELSGPVGVPRLVSIWSRRSNLDPLRKLLGHDQPNVACVLDLSGLEEMSVALKGGPTGMDAFGVVLQHAESLKSLSLSASYYDHINFKGKLASKLNHFSLRTLKTVNITTMVEDQETDPYLYFVDELEQIAGRNVLETLSIEVDIETDARPTTDLSKWAQLNRVLSAADDAFPFLRSVSLKITIYRFSPLPDELQAVFDSMETEGFGWLRNNKKLDFLFEVVVDNV